MTLFKNISAFLGFLILSEPFIALALLLAWLAILYIHVWKTNSYYMRFLLIEFSFSRAVRDELPFAQCD